MKKLPVWLTVLQIIYLVSCVVSTVFFAINRYCDIRLFFDLGVIITYGWMVNPVGILSLVTGITTGIVRNRQRGWLQCIFWFVVDLVLFFVVGGLMVEFTGGV